MYLNETMKNILLNEKNLEVLRRHAVENGMIPLFDSCKNLVLKGETSIQELMTLFIE